MKIALVTETFIPSTDGIVVRLSQAVDYLLKEGHEVIIIAPDVGKVPTYYKQAKIYPMPAKTFFFYKQRPWALPTTQVGKLFKAFQPDLVHAANPFSLTASAVYYAKKYMIPLVCSFHTNIPDYLSHYGFKFLEPVVWAYLKKLHQQADVNLVTSKAMYDLLDQHGIGDLDILPLGVDVENRHPRFYSKEMRERLTAGELDKKLLIFVGRLAAEKNIQALKSLMAERADLRLAIVGDGPEKDKLEELFAGTPTVFTGFLHGRELSEAYASADAFVFPSRSETLGLVITESMASGTPVIAAYSPPTAEQIDHRSNGIMYGGPGLLSLSESVDLLDDSALMADISQQARNYALQFSWENASKAILASYEKALRKSKNKTQY